MADEQTVRGLIGYYVTLAMVAASLQINDLAWEIIKKLPF